MNPDDDTLARDCAATAEAAAALRPRLSCGHDCTATDMRLARAVKALREIERLARANSFLLVALDIAEDAKRALAAAGGDV